MRKIRILIAALFCFALSNATLAAVHEYPSRPVKIVVGFAVGGGTDIPARIIAKEARRHAQQQVIVENRPGGGGVLATELVAASPPDGYTLLLGAVGACSR